MLVLSGFKWGCGSPKIWLNPTYSSLHPLFHPSDTLEVELGSVVLQYVKIFLTRFRMLLQNSLSMSVYHYIYYLSIAYCLQGNNVDLMLQITTSIRCMLSFPFISRMWSTARDWEFLFILCDKYDYFYGNLAGTTSKCEKFCFKHAWFKILSQTYLLMGIGDIRLCRMCV